MSNRNVVNLAKDLAVGKLKTQKFSADEANDSLRKAIGDIIGVKDMDNYKMTERQFVRNAKAIFEIIEEVLDNSLEIDMRNEFGDWVEYRNYALGDSPEFYTPDDQLFKVALVSDGTQNILRQRIRGGQAIRVKTNTYAVKIYEELNRFLSGRIDWAEMVSTMSTSFAVKVRDDIMKAIVNQFSEASAEFKLTNVGTPPNEKAVLALAQKVKARTRQNVAIYGTLLALHDIVPNVTSDAQDGERNNTGYYTTIAGIPMYELAQTTLNETGEFMLGDNFLLVLPDTRDKMIKVLNEGESRVIENNPDNVASFDLEATMINKMGIAVIPSSVYGYISYDA